MVSHTVSGTMCKGTYIKKEVSEKFKFLMLFFVLIVVIFHSGLRYHYPFIEDLTAMANVYFFCVSAFFFYRGLDDNNIYERLKKRSLTLLLPYLLWNLTYFIFSMRNFDFDIVDIIRGFTVSNFCQPSWYLLTLYIFFMCSLFLKEAFKKIYSTVIVVIIGVVLSYCGYILFQVELISIPFIGGYLIRMSEYLTPYLIGAALGTWFDKKIDTNIIRNILGLICSVLIVILLLKNIPPGIRWMLWVVFPMVLWNALPEAMFKPFKILKWITEPAFFISMLHCYLLNIGSSLILKYLAVSEKEIAFLSVIFSVAMCYGGYFLLKIFLPNILSYYMGNRFKVAKNKSM